MNNTKTLAAIAAILIAGTLVVAGTLTATSETSSFAYQKKRGQDDSKNGSTVTIQACKQKGSVSGFDNTAEQECGNTICTHPGENATCVQEGAAAQTQTPTPTPTPTPEPITTTLRIIKQVVCQPGSNCSLPSDCTISLFTPPHPQQSFACTSAIGNGVVFTLQPGDTFEVLEAISPNTFAVSTSGNCGPSIIAAGQHVTCTIINTEIPG
jgi:hypothetical protein